MLLIQPLLLHFSLALALLFSHPAQATCPLVILAQPADPFYPLAVEIAAAEKAPLKHSLAEALACQPEFLLWVVSPGFLSDQVFVDFGLAIKAQAFPPASGLISASTLDSARQLWQRRSQVDGQIVAAVNAANPAAHLPAQIQVTEASGQSTRQALTKSNFASTLQNVGYLTFTGHGSNRYLRLDDETTLTAAEVPSLGPLVLATGSCQTFRLWNQDSIARRFADQGAAAYSGFVYSPNEGYLLGEFDGLPFRYTWPEFTIGHVVQIQNRGTLQGFAALPYQHLLGDPRIAFQAEPPYQLISDESDGQSRTLVYRGLPGGVVPIRIPGGAAYRYVHAEGLTAAAQDDPFYNSRLQMLDLQADKLLLLVHSGGDLTLRLERHVPWYWYPLDIWLDALDHTLIYAQQSSGDLLALAFSSLPLLWLGWQVFKKRLSRPAVRLALLIGLVAAAWHGIYIVTRLAQVTITSKPVVFSPLSLLATFILTTCGALIYFQARAWLGRACGLLVATFSLWVPGVFAWGLVLVFNRFFFIPQLGAPLYNQALTLLPLCAWSGLAVLLGVTLRSSRRRLTRQPHPSIATS